MNADAKHKLIRHYAVTDAAVHDSQGLDGLLDTGNTCNDVFADSAYRSTKIEGRLRASGFKSRIHRRATRNHPLSNAQLKANRNRSKIRARIEHVFGARRVLAGRPDRAHDRHRAGTRQDWLAEPGLQHSPPCDAGAHRHRMRVKSARSIRKGASSGQTAASLVENHARKPPSSALIANHASKPALFEVPFRLIPNDCNISGVGEVFGAFTWGQSELPARQGVASVALNGATASIELRSADARSSE